jgi:hypothetical protein
MKNSYTKIRIVQIQILVLTLIIGKKKITFHKEETIPFDSNTSAIMHSESFDNIDKTDVGKLHDIKPKEGLAEKYNSNDISFVSTTPMKQQTMTQWN